MVTVNVDISDLNLSLELQKAALARTEDWLRPLAIELAGIMSYRIHTQGLASDGSRIGSYKKSYLDFRKRKGLGESEEVILVLTRKLTNSWNAFATVQGWAVGFVDSSGAKGSEVSSLEKLKYAQEHFGKIILNLTEDENKFISERLPQLINPLFLQNNG